MLEASVRRTRIDKRDHPQLADPRQSSKRGRIDDALNALGDRNVDIR